jgi:hypothetical protein
LIRRRGTRDGPARVLTNTNHAAPQPCCPVPVPGKVYLQLSRDSLVVDLLGVLGPSPKVRGG